MAQIKAITFCGNDKTDKQETDEQKFNKNNSRSNKVEEKT